jgi:hypothetical protein
LESLNAMIEFSISLVEFILATFAPLYVGMVFITYLQMKFKLSVRYLSAFALGLMFWFFFDTLNDSVQLDVNEGFNFPASHIGLVSVFVFGFLVIALLSTFLVSKKTNRIDAGVSAYFDAAIVVAVGMGFHGIGEGVEFGGLSAGTQAFTILDAIGGYSGGISYIIHKFLEATIVMIVYIGLTVGEHASFRSKLSKITTLGLAFGLPSAFGEVIGYFVELNSAYFFALGAGAALSVTLLIVWPMFRTTEDGQLTYSQWTRLMLAALIGFLCLYGAALFHSG